MKATETFYHPIFQSNFHLVDTDYVFGDKKFGGNAQAISGNRFCHHTSFLWKYDINLMSSILKTPQKQPDYRKNRPHSDFLTSLSSEVTFSVEDFEGLLLNQLSSTFKAVVECNTGDILKYVDSSAHRVKTELLH